MKTAVGLSNTSSQFRRSKITMAVSLATMATALSVSAAKAAEIQEIVVTSQMREQTLGEVPITVSVFDGNFMENAQFTDAKELALLTPGVAGDSDDSFLDTINIRGISTNDFGVGAEPSVGVYQDGIYLGRTGGAVSSFFDLDRVEVVKGPQGTLFGRNASAGAFNISTNKPTQENTAYANFGVGENGYNEFTGVVNRQLDDEWSSRFALYRQEQDAWVKNALTGENVGGLEVLAGRFTLAHSGEVVTTTLMLEYEDRLMPPSIYRVFDADNTGLDFFQSNVANKDEFESDRRADQMFDEGEVWGGTLTAEADLSNNYKFTSITGLRGHNYHYSEDFDGSGLDIFNYEQIQEQDYFSQEFRLNYEGDGRISWFVGASLYKEDLKTHYNQTFDEDTMCATWGQAYYGYDSDYVSDCSSSYNYYNWYYYYSPYNNDGVVYDYFSDFAASDYYYDYGPGIGMRNDEVDIDAEYEGWGIYGDVTTSLTDRLDLVVGGRYTVDKRDFSVMQNGFADSYFFYSFPYYTSTPISADKEWTNFSARAALNFKVNDDVSIYGNVSTGYKAGGFNTFFLQFNNADVEDTDIFPFNGSTDASNPALGATPEEFDEEEVTNYEVGFKSVLFDGSMRLNANTYFYQFDNMQAGAYKNGSIYLLKNVGDAEGSGVEMDMRWLPTDNLDIYLGMAWADTELTRAAPEFCEIVSCEEGAQLSGTIDFSSSLVATYTVPLRQGNMFFTWESFHQSDSPGFGEFSKSPLMLDGFTTSNLRIGYQSLDDWRVSFWVNNITDEFYYKGVAGQEGNLGAHHFGFSEPRRAGVRFSVNF